jgi:hypothetical protein
MRKTLYFFILLTDFLSSCSSDNESNNIPINSQNLIGIWYIKGGTTNNGPFENYINECPSNKDFQKFLSNGEVTFNGYNSSCTLAAPETSLWLLNGSTLTISNTNFDPMIYSYEYEIERLTSGELILKEIVNEPEGIVTYRTTFTRN